MAKWIRCEDRLPELKQPVLVTAYGRVCYAYMVTIDGNYGHPEFRLHDMRSMNRDSHFILETTAHSEMTKGRISAWMPIEIPEAYKGGE